MTHNKKVQYRNRVCSKMHFATNPVGFRKIEQKKEIGPEVVHRYVERSDLFIA